MTKSSHIKKRAKSPLSKKKQTRNHHYCITNIPYNHKEAIGAGNGIRTRDIKLGKLALYQLSYARVITVLPIT